MSELWAIINSGIVILIISGAAGYVKGYIDKHNKENEERERLFQELLESNKQMIQWHEENVRRDKELKKELDHLATCVKHITNGGKVLLRDRIIQSCRVFIERGGVTTIARSNITDMYHWYHDELGGNGLGELYYNKMMALPLIDEGIPIVSKMHLDADLKE